MPAPDKPNGRPSPDKAAAQVSAQEHRTTMDLGEVLELAEKPAEDEDPKPAKSKKPAQVLSRNVARTWPSRALPSWASSAP